MTAKSLPTLIVMLWLTTAGRATLGQEPSSTDGPDRDPPWEFFAFDNGVGRDAGWPPARQAEFLDDLGYDGIGYTGTTDLEARFAAFDRHQLRIHSLYIPFESSKEPPVSPEVIQALPALKNKRVTLWLHIHGSASDQQTADRLRVLADKAAAFGVRIAIYPHHAFQVETAEHAVQIVRAVDRPNVGASFNLCHELRAGNGRRIKEIIRKTADHLTMVSINGARQAEPTESARSWESLIMPLGDGDYDVLEVLRELKAADYQGPIGLQCYNIRQTPEEMLKHSIEAWHAYGSELE